MTNKIKLIFPVLALGLVLVGGTAFAATTTTTPSVKTGTTEVNKKIKTTVSPERIACIAAAKTARAAQIKTTNDTAKKAKLDAKTTRDASLKTAKANTDKVVKAAAIKVANATYKQAVKDANTALTASLKVAKADYATAIKACPVK